MESIDMLKLVELRNTVFDTQGDWVDLTAEEWADVDRWISNVWATTSKSVEGVPVTFNDRYQCLVKRMYRYCQDRRRGGSRHGQPSKPKQGIRNKHTLPFIDCKASTILIYRFHPTTGEALGISVKTKQRHSHSLQDSDARGNSFGIRSVSRQLMASNGGNILGVLKILQNQYSQVGGATISKHSIRASGREGDEKLPPILSRIPALSPAEMQRSKDLPYVPPQVASRSDLSVPQATITYGPASVNTSALFAQPAQPTQKTHTPAMKPATHVEDMSLASLLSNLDSARVVDDQPRQSFSFSYDGA